MTALAADALDVTRQPFAAGQHQDVQDEPRRRTVGSDRCISAVDGYICVPVQVPPHGDAHVTRVGEICNPRTGRRSRTGPAERPGTSGAIDYELQDEAQFALAQEGFDCADNPGLAVDYQPVAHLERLVAHEMPGRDNLVTAAKLISIVDAGHRQDMTIRAPRDSWALVLSRGERRSRAGSDVCSRA